MVAAPGGSTVSAQSPVAEVYCLGPAMKGREKDKKRPINAMSILAPQLGAKLVAVLGEVGECAQKRVEVDLKPGIVLKEETKASKKSAAVAGSIVQHRHHNR